MSVRRRKAPRAHSCCSPRLLRCAPARSQPPTPIEADAGLAGAARAAPRGRSIAARRQATKRTYFGSARRRPVEDTTRARRGPVTDGKSKLVVRRAGSLESIPIRLLGWASPHSRQHLPGDVVYKYISRKNVTQRACPVAGNRKIRLHPTVERLFVLVR